MLAQSPLLSAIQRISRCTFRPLRQFRSAQLPLRTCRSWTATTATDPFQSISIASYPRISACPLPPRFLSTLLPRWKSSRALSRRRNAVVAHAASFFTPSPCLVSIILCALSLLFRSQAYEYPPWPVVVLMKYANYLPLLLDPRHDLQSTILCRLGHIRGFFLGRLALGVNTVFLVDWEADPCFHCACLRSLGHHLSMTKPKRILGLADCKQNMRSVHFNASLFQSYFLLYNNFFLLEWPQ